jgi:SP family general alpha glucoside:H+ symporter-like MFS transporter
VSCLLLNLTTARPLTTQPARKVFASQIGGKLVIEAGWQAAWGAMYNVMTLIGSLVAAQLQDIFGRRAVFLSAIIFAVSGTAVNFVAKNSVQFLGGKILTGFSIGLVLTVAQTYISEIAPLPMRSIALSFNTIAMVSRKLFIHHR